MFDSYANKLDRLVARYETSAISIEGAITETYHLPNSGLTLHSKHCVVEIYDGSKFVSRQVGLGTALHAAMRHRGLVRRREPNPRMVDALGKITGELIAMAYKNLYIDDSSSLRLFVSPSDDQVIDFWEAARKRGRTIPNDRELDKIRMMNRLSAGGPRGYQWPIR